MGLNQGGRGTCAECRGGGASGIWSGLECFALRGRRQGDRQWPGMWDGGVEASIFGSPQGRAMNCTMPHAWKRRAACVPFSSSLHCNFRGVCGNRDCLGFCIRHLCRRKAPYRDKYVSHKCKVRCSQRTVLSGCGCGCGCTTGTYVQYYHLTLM